MKSIFIILLILITSAKVYSQSNYEEIKVVLDSVHKTDQLFRKQINPIVKMYGWNSEEYNSLSAQIRKQDSTNLVIAENIINNYGWLGVDKIGEEGNKTLFLVIQHQPHKVQESYLPVMRKAYEKGNALGKDLALLEDRVATHNGEKQIYGSQLGVDSDGSYFLLPILDPENVNKRRAEMGLGTIEDYMKLWDLTWDVNKHIATSDEKLKELREQLKYVIE